MNLQRAEAEETFEWEKTQVEAEEEEDMDELARKDWLLFEAWRVGLTEH